MGHLRHALAATTLALLVPLSACGSSDVAKDPAVSAPTSAATSASGTPGTYPTLAATDYTYRLQVLCYCALVGPVDITVKAGAVDSATIASGPGKGKPAPAYVEKTMNDLIGIANDPSTNAKVAWPKGADVPQRITVSPVRRTTDATITYVISDYRAS